jgi:hypothetical protein
MTKLQRKNWELYSVSYEQIILAYFKSRPESKPDGSFIMNLVLRAYRAGVREGKKR